MEQWIAHRIQKSDIRDRIPVEFMTFTYVLEKDMYLSSFLSPHLNRHAVL